MRASSTCQGIRPSIRSRNNSRRVLRFFPWYSKSENVGWSIGFPSSTGLSTVPPTMPQSFPLVQSILGTGFAPSFASCRWTTRPKDTVRPSNSTASGGRLMTLGRWLAALAMLAITVAFIGLFIWATAGQPHEPTHLPEAGDEPTPVPEMTEQELDQLVADAEAAWASHVPVVAGIPLELPEDAIVDALVAKSHPVELPAGLDLRRLELPVYLIVRHGEMADVSKATGEFSDRRRPPGHIPVPDRPDGTGQDAAGPHGLLREALGDVPGRLQVRRRQRKHRSRTGFNALDSRGCLPYD